MNPVVARVRHEDGRSAGATPTPAPTRYRLSPWTRIRLTWMQTQEYRLWRQSLSLRVWR